ncbi:threonine--tRNA ligase [Methanococcoides sp. SA1]|nr:threonine--tRNA ligase [Methanococcoides sp. SA1]
MKTLNLHCDFLKFKAQKKAIKSIDEIAPDQLKEGESTDCLAVLTAVESHDTHDSVAKIVESIKELAEKLQTNNIVLYPYAHLSQNLASPESAVSILDKIEEKLEGLNILKAPFGYYKQFSLQVKGHPMSELSREFKIEGNEEAEDLSDKERKKLLRQISKAKLDTSKLKDNDHRIIGGKMDLWSFNNVAPGMVFWHPKGLHIKKKLEGLWRELHRKDGYKEISTPQIMDRKLWEVSGHWSKYGENNFKTQYEKRDFIVKPMSCPGGMLVYKTSPKTYKDLPLRVGEAGIVHRVELSGTLGGLFRVIQFTQDDAHVYCTKDQLASEIQKVIDLINATFKPFNLEFDHVELSTRPEKRIGSEEIWDASEKALEKALKKSGMKYEVNEGDGAFYGPKIDFHLKDSLNRTWQCSTLQLDMALPERFDLTYQDKDNNNQRPLMLHNAIYGSVERFIGIITEHFNGKFPLWLSPNQVKVMTLNDDAKDYAKEIYQKLFDAGYQVELNDKSESMGKKAREASIQRFNYILTVGEDEMKKNQVAIKMRDTKEIQKISLEEFQKKLEQEILTKQL